MTGPFKIQMKEATRLTRLGKLDEAVRVIMAGLQSRKVTPAAEGLGERRIWLGGERTPAKTTDAIFEPAAEALPRVKPDEAQAADPLPTRKAPSEGDVSSHIYSNAAGTRHYKLYVPGQHHEGPLPLVVMLHGCTQSPDDFAAGTGMNALADEIGFVVAYPAQPQSANPTKCWNWFNKADQQRDQGEPSLIAGITHEVMREHDVDPGRVFIAGLSAGGAAAAIMAETYPELYSAVGIHSGLACGAARDMASAFTAMKQGPVGAPLKTRTSKPVPVIVFHGDRDQTVHHVNAAAIIDRGADYYMSAQSDGRSTGGVGYTRTVYHDRDGNPTMESWTVHGGGHAWFGGSAAGTYTDPAGPDASREMLRFFLQHARK